jgi:fucose 4-O-acetylase-like acetyltransferase
MRQYSRLTEISFLQNLGITLVVAGHAILFMNDKHLAGPAFNYLFNLIYSFHMPLFMSLAGYLFIHTNIDRGKIGYKEFVVKKFKRLIIPYLFISSIAFIPKTFLSAYALRPAEHSLIFYFRNIFYPGENVIINFWFLPTLFLIFIFFILIRNTNIYKNYYFISALTVALVVLYIYSPLNKIRILNLGGVVQYLVFFWLGCILRLFRNDLKFLRKKPFLLCVLSLLLLFNSLSFDVRYFKLIKAIVGILFSYSLAAIYSSKKIRLFNFIDGYYYQIYLLSWFFETFVRIVFFQKFGINYYLASVLIFFAGLIMPVLVVRMVNKKLPYLRLALGI